MKILPTHKILIVGLGLLGGSYAMALKRQGFTVYAITKEQSSIDYALENGLIDKGSVSVEDELLQEADIVVFALYPHVFIEWIQEYGHRLREGTILTDVTGVKCSVVYEVQSLLKDGVEFIAAHPMAGRESSGVENSTDKIFENAKAETTAANIQENIKSKACMPK